METLRAYLFAPLRVFREWQMLLTLWAVHLGVALLASLPLLPAVLARYTHAAPARGLPLTSSFLLLDVTRVFEKVGGTAGVMALLSFLVAAGVGLLFAGGVMTRLLVREPFYLSRFVSDSVRLLGRGLRLYLWNLLTLLAVVGAVALSAFLLYRGKHVTVFTQRPDTWLVGPSWTRASALHALFSLFLLGLWHATLDASRALMVTTGVTVTRKLWWRALLQTLRAPVSVLGYCLWGAVAFVALAFLMRAHSAVNEASLSGAWLALVVAQGVVFVRGGLSLLSTAWIASRYPGPPPTL